MSGDLERHLKWLKIPDCKCSFEWKSLGRLYGISFGKGWVRMNTHPDCPNHSEDKK